MKINKYLKKCVFSAAFSLCFFTFVFAQNVNFSAPPRQEKLLNGLKVLVWSDLNAPKVSVSLRIHSGSAFDPQEKEGVMALLGEILFPNDAAREFFAEDLGGSLEIISNYDYIQINATGDNDQVLTILETIAAAVDKPRIDKETTALAKARKLEKVVETEKDFSQIADQAVAKRLFGNFPYGRPQFGTSESLAKIDFADILLAKQKFLTADNATLAVSGSVKPDLVFRAARRYFGGWEKADKKVPPTFTQPDAPDEKLLVLSVPSIKTEENRTAVSGFARNDRDFFASRILTKILAMRYPADSFENKSFLLRGIIISRSSAGKPFLKNGETDSNLKTSANAQILQIKADDFEKAKTQVLEELLKRNLTDFWLDLETYKLVSIKDEMQKAKNVKLEDVQRVFDKLRSQPAVTISLRKGQETTSPNN